MLQVDLRILKAVAIEHPSDVDAAAESIIVEILPSIASFHEASSTPPDANEVAHASTSSSVSFVLWLIFINFLLLVLILF